MTNQGDDKGFKVVDRRVGVEESKEEAKEGPVQGPGWEMREEEGQRKGSALPPMDFTAFCLSLASSAMIHLGLAEHPESGKSQKDLPLAKQTIDILDLLEKKTRGNLTEDESKLLGTLLYDLRMRFLDASRA
jgi:hypothetical protein